MTTIQEQELEQEAQLSRRTLERVPEDRLEWRPHEKSMTLGPLASHVAALPRGALLRSVLFSHWSHHRGQLTVYLRLTGAPVPALYGDNADEPTPTA